MPEYDVVVIGSGPAGYAAAFRAAQLGGRVAMIEKGALGGTCLNRGCVPTKSLLEAAGVLEQMRRADALGLACESPRADMARLIERKDRHVAKLRGGVAQLAKGLGIEIVGGTATIAARNAVRVESAEGDRTLATKAIIIASGSEPQALASLPFDHTTVLSSTDVLDRDTVPETLLIVGGDDAPVIRVNREAAELLAAEHQLEIVPGAGHLFEEPGKLDEVARLSREWFDRHLAGGGR